MMAYRMGFMMAKWIWAADPLRYGVQLWIWAADPLRGWVQLETVK